MKNKLLLKVCGMRDEKNIDMLSKIAPDFIGFIFHKSSPRNLSEYPNVDIPDSIKKVGVFVNKPLEFILEKVSSFFPHDLRLLGSLNHDAECGCAV